MFYELLAVTLKLGTRLSLIPLAVRE
jgi:hypothetical protein